MPTIKLDIEVDTSKGTATLKQFAGDAEAAAHAAYSAMHATAAQAKKRKAPAKAA